MRTVHLHHIHIILLVGLFLAGLILITANIQTEAAYKNNSIKIGVSYSPDYAKELGLNPKQTYLSMLQDLQVKRVRLPAYWDIIEPRKNQYDFEELDWYIEQAKKYDAEIVLAVGFKLPRWPECRAPKWIDQGNIPELRANQLEMVKAVVNRYNANPTISSFQIENEPFFEFGECPKPDPEFLKSEVLQVKTLTQKPIIVTDAGELSSWIDAMQASDTFGTTLYRTVDTPWFGPFQYPLRPWLYRIKSDLVRKFFAPQNKETIIAELQAEPWATQSLAEIPIETLSQKFTVKQLNEAVNFSKKTGFEEIDLWGVEWWYYMNQNNHPEYLDYITNRLNPR